LRTAACACFDPQRKGVIFAGGLINVLDFDS
jgi:hypothetical protein